MIQPLHERVTEWRKSAQQTNSKIPKRAESPANCRSPVKRNFSLRKGFSTENLVNKIGNVMTLSRKNSRKPSRDRIHSTENDKHSPLGVLIQESSFSGVIEESVRRETLDANVTENRARISIFARSMTPYINSHTELQAAAQQIASINMSKPSLISQNAVRHWVSHIL